MYQPPSPRFSSELPAKQLKTQKPAEEKKNLISYVNPREQIADLVMQIQKNSLPIALEKKYTYDKRIVFMPSENPPDDPAGSILFTKHGFFEIPKEKNLASKFVSKREFIMESYYKDVFSKLPLVVNFYRRKFLNKWFREARKAHYDRNRKQFIEKI